SVRLLPPTAVARASMPDHRPGHHHHAVTGQPCPLAQVAAVLERSQHRVRPTQAAPQTTFDQHPGGTYCEHVVSAVVLALVDLAVLDPGEPAAPPGGPGDTRDQP